MARIQILELPTEHHGDDMVTPFVLVIDKVQNPESMLDFLRDPPHLRDELGARTILVFDEAVEIPANETSASPEPEAVSEPDYTEMAALVGRALGINITAGEPDVAGWLHTACRELLKSDDARAQLRDELSEARQWARHGYEIGQKHCGWTDHGVAPDWLTEGWPPHFDSCEHLKRASDYDEALTRVRNLPEHPDIMDARHEQPDGYLHGYRVAIKDAKRTAWNAKPPAWKQAAEDEA